MIVNYFGAKQLFEYVNMVIVQLCLSVCPYNLKIISVSYSVMGL